MVVTVDRSSGEPVYGQIARQLREHIASGRLSAGTSLPAVRALASDLGVNLNTVARAYRQLEDEGFLRIRERAGAEVAAPSRGPSRGDRLRLRSELAELLARMRQAGLASAELKQIALSAIDSLGEGGRTR